MAASEEFPGKVKEYEALYRVASHLYDVMANMGDMMHIQAVPYPIIKNLAM